MESIPGADLDWAAINFLTKAETDELTGSVPLALRGSPGYGSGYGSGSGDGYGDGG
jgi:hypothetical protein